MDFDGYMVEVLEEESSRVVLAPKRYLRDAQNPFELYREREFIQRYRFRKETILNVILPLVENNLKKNNLRGLPIAPVMQLLLCLRFYATGSFQIVLGDLLSLSQPTASRVVERVSNLLALQMRQFIKMPANPTITKQLFEDLQKRPGHESDQCIPNVLGAIDCTHVRLVSTRLRQVAEVYRNRKSYFSLNVQAVVGPQMEFLDIVHNWPGSAHDSRIFQNSRLCHRFRSSELPGVLLGDSGYRSTPYMFTPFLEPQTPAEIRYNRAQKRGRNVVERAFGIWKRRFPCVSKGLGTKLETTTSIVMACAVLHNISLLVNDRWPLTEELIDEVPVEAPVEQPIDGIIARREIVRLYFS